MRYKLIVGVNVTDDIQQKIADRVGIERATLNKILNRKTTCTKAVAWYITYLHLKASKMELSDKLLLEYFEEV